MIRSHLSTLSEHEEKTKAGPLTESHWHPAAPSLQPQLQLKPSFQLPQSEGGYNPCARMEGTGESFSPR